jgi:uncharacterized protein (TIGR00369 family)
MACCQVAGLQDCTYNSCRHKQLARPVAVGGWRESGMDAAAQARLQEWLEDEARIAFFEAMMDGRLPGAPIAATLDFILVRVEPGFAVFQGQPKQHHYNPLGTVHGGWYATLLDSALGCAVHSRLPPGKSYTTLELKLNLVRALRDDVARVRAEGRVVHAGSQVATAEARLVGPDGRLYAHGTTTCLIFDTRV